MQFRLINIFQESFFVTTLQFSGIEIVKLVTFLDFHTYVFPPWGRVTSEIILLV